MAHVDRIWLNDSKDKTPSMRVYVKLKPSGEVAIDVPLPGSFNKAILAMAQAAADKHEAEMHAQILGERHAAA